MSPEVLVDLLQAAFTAEDLDLLAPLLDENVRWGGDEDTPDTCHSRADVLAWYRGLFDRGVRGRIIETIVSPGAVILGLAVTWPDAVESRSDVVYQVLALSPVGQIADIRGFPDREEALDAVGSLP